MSVLLRLAWISIIPWIISVLFCFYFTFDSFKSTPDPSGIQISSLVDAVVYISMGEMSKEAYADISIETLRKIGQWRGLIYLITDHPDCYKHLTKSLNVEILEAPSMSDIIEIKSLKTRLFEFLPSSVNSVIYLDVDIILTQKLHNLLRDMVITNPCTTNDQRIFPTSINTSLIQHPANYCASSFDMALFLDAGGHFVGFCSGCDKWHTGVLWLKRNHGITCLKEWGNILKSGKFTTDQESLDEAERLGHCRNLKTLPFRHLLFAKDYLMMIFRAGQTFTHLTAITRIKTQDFFYRDFIVPRLRASITPYIEDRGFEFTKICL